MAVLALAAAGATSGAAIGGTFLGVSAASWGWSIGALAGNLLFPAKTPDQHREGPRYNDLKIIASEYGRVVPLIYGAYPTAGNIIWASEVREVATTTSQSAGGKGGGGGQTVTSTTYAYFVDFAVLLGEGELAGVRKIKFQGELKFNVADDASTQTVVASSLNATAVRFYPGSESQSVDPLIEAAEGTSAPAYRGSSYIVFENFDVTPYGGRVPQMEFEVVAAGTLATTLVISTGDIVTTNTVASVATMPVLGRNGDVYFPGATSNQAIRVNYHTRTVQTVYSRTTWTFIPVSQHTSGAVAFANYGGYLGFFNEDGTYSEYSGAPGILGVNGGMSWASSTTGYAQGDSSSTTNLYRFALDGGTVVETLLSGARSVRLFKNATGIAGRCYVYGSTTYTHDIGYITSSDSKVLLLTGTSYSPEGLLVSRDGFLWMARNSGSSDIEVRDADGTLISSVATPGSVTVSRIFQSNDGYIWCYAGSGAMFSIHPTLHTVESSSVSVGTKVPLGFTEDNRLIFYSTSGADILLHEMEPLPRLAAGTTSAADVVGDILERVGLAPSDLSLSPLAGDTVRGYAIGRRMTARAAVEPILAAFRAELVESDYVLKAVKRGGAVAMAIDELDLGAHHYGAEVLPSMVERRLLETDLPMQVTVEYPDASGGYEVGSQYARRLVGASNDGEVVTLGLVLTADEAQQLAEILLYDRWVSRMVYQLSLPRKYSRLEPTDIVSVSLDGADYTLRIISLRDDDGVLSLECVAEDAAIYDATGSGASPPTAADEVPQTGPTTLRFLDIPLLRDADDAPGFYLGANGYYGWQGAELFRSIDNGASYVQTDTALLAAATFGSATTALATYTGGYTFDEHNSVDVQLVGSATLTSATALEVLAGANAAYIAGEIIQFKTATQIATGKYRLTGLLRGQKGTEQYMATHAIGDPFVLLDTSHIYRIAHTEADIGIERVYKGATLGQYLTSAAPIAFTSNSVGQKPLAPINLRAGRTANASWGITGGWTRRTRVGSTWRDFVDASLGEASEAYEVEIYTSSAFTTLKRTITSTVSGGGSLVVPASQSFTYSNADQVTDFGSSQSTIYVRVYQLSAVVGRGFPAQGTLTV